jgi:FMN reductase
MSKTQKFAPLIVGIGGSIGQKSATDISLELALKQAELNGARTLLFGGQELCSLPLYLTKDSNSSTVANDMLNAIRQADGVIIASPGYHGTISGVVKNAIDYIQDTWQDSRPYLNNMPVGLIAVAGGHQAAVSTLATLRTITHALRGWPTPFGVTINSSGGVFSDGSCNDKTVKDHLRLVGAQVTQFAKNSPFAIAVDAISD